MKVAQIAPLFESVPPLRYGGTERVIHNLTRGLLAAGVEVTVFCSGDSTTGGERVSVWPTALRLSEGMVRNPSAYQVRMLEAVARRAGDFDIIHNHFDFGLLPLKRIAPEPLLTTFHNRLDGIDLRAALEYYADCAFVSISDAQREPLPTLGWLATVHHGIELASYRFQPKPGDYLAFLGRFSPEKGAHHAIEIARKAGLPLKLAAKIDESNPDYYARVIKPQCDGRDVEYVGEIAEHEKSEFLGGAAALLNPIDWPEPFGLVMVEAMACGTPVLTRPVGSAPELMVEGLTGFLRTDHDELVNLVEPARRLDRRAIRSYAERRYSTERMTREYLNVYRRLITGHGTGTQVGAPGSRRPEVRIQSAHPGRVAGHRRDLLHPVDGPGDGDHQGLA